MAQENNNPRLPIISQNVNLLEVENTSNAFALVLAFYFQYRRSFLISSNCNTALNKIALKYGKTDGQQLLKDLFAKYRLPVPTSCSYSFCMKILSIFNIPNSYRQLLPSCFHENIEADQWKYDAELDVTSKIFDAEQVFTQKKIFTSLNSKMIYDNLSKVAHLIPGNQVGNRFDIQVAQEKLLAKKAYKEENQVIDELNHLHPLQLTIKIALSYYKDKSTHDKSHPDGKGPLCMLAQCVENRSRIQVVIRKRKGYVTSYYYNRDVNRII